jgi:hypothetical protein
MKKVLKGIQHPSVRLASSLTGISSEGFLRKTNACKLEQKERRERLFSPAFILNLLLTEI